MKRLLAILLILLLVGVAPVAANPIDDFWNWITGASTDEVVNIPIYTNTTTAYNQGQITAATLYEGTLYLKYHMDTIPENGGITVELYCPDSMGYMMPVASGDAFKETGEHAFSVSDVDGCYAAMVENDGGMF